MNKTTYWCDRCGIEVAIEQLRWVTVETDGASESRPERRHYELCEPCETEVLGAMTDEIQKAGVA